MIDSHHHLWAYSEAEYSWIPADTPCRTNFLVPELEAATDSAGVTGTVAVQARQVTAESDALLAMGRETDRILGVVGWVPLIDPRVGVELDRLYPEPKFKGVRHVLQDEPDDYFLRDDFHQGLSLLPSRDLRYDLLLFQRQLPVGVQLVDRQPQLGIIVDHIAKPEVHPGRIEDDWKRGMRELAERDNIIGVKFSGLATEFPAGDIDPDTVRAYFHESLEIFGADRLMFGTDWPVALFRLDSYKVWADTVRDLASSLSPDERDAVLGGNCKRAYRL